MQADDLILLDQLVDAFKAQLKKTHHSPSALEIELKSIKKKIKKSIVPKLSLDKVRGLNGWLRLIEAQADRFGDGSKPSSEFELKYLSPIDSEISRLTCDAEIILVILQSEYRKDQTISAALLKCDKAFRSSFDPIVYCAILQEIEEQAQIIALGMIAPALTNCYGIALEQQFALMSRNKLIEFARGFFSIEMTQWIEGLWAFINMISMTAARNNRMVVNTVHILQRFEQARYSVLTVLQTKNGKPSNPPVVDKSYFLLSSLRTYSELSANEKQLIEVAIRNEMKRDLLYQNNISMHVQLEAADSDVLIEKTAALTIIYSCLRKPIKNAFEALSLALGFFSFKANNFIYHLSCIEEFASNIFATAKIREPSRVLFHAPLGDCSTPFIVVLQALLCKMTKIELIKFADKIYEPNCDGFYRALWATIYDEQNELPPDDQLRFDNHVRGKITKSIIQFELLRDALDLILMMRGLQSRNLLANKKVWQFSDLNKSAIPQKHLSLVQEIISNWKTTFEIIRDRHVDSEYSSTLYRL